MAHRSRSLPFTLAFAGLIAATCNARAADDDFDFAQALSNRGYQDLAEEQYRELLSDPSKSAKEKAEGQYGLALIKRFNANQSANEANESRRKPLPEVLALFDEADTALQQFIDSNSSHPRLLEAKLDRAKLITDRADYINRAIENGWVPAGTAVDELKRKVAGGYDTAIGLLKSVEDVAREDWKSFQPGTDERADAEDRLGLVWLYRIVALYGKGAALPADNSEGRDALDTVLNEVVEFAWIFEGTVRGLWAYHYGALASWRLGDSAEALRGMKETATFVKEDDGFAAVRSVSLQSYEKLATMAIDMASKGNEEAIPFADAALTGMKDNWPSYMDDSFGQRAALAHARLMAQNGQAPRAVGVVQDVLRKAGAARTGVEADAGRVLDQLMASGVAGVKLDPGLLRTRATSKWRDSDYDGAIAAYQDLIAACTTPALQDEFGWFAWDKIGQCHWLAGRWQKAFDAFDFIEKAWEKDKTNDVLIELTNETGWSRVFALNKMAEAETDPAKKKQILARAKSEEDAFKEAHPDSRYNQGLEVQKAEAALREGRNLRRSGDHDAAIAKLGEAIKLLKAVPADSNAIDKVEAEIAQAHHEIGRAQIGKGDEAAAHASFDTCIQLSEAWVAKSRPDVVDRSVRRNRDSGRSIALTNILTSLSGKADATTDAAKRTAIFTTFITALDKYEADFVGSVNRGQTLVDQWRVEALIGTGKVEDAELLVSALLKKNPELKNGPYLAALVAQALERDANSWKSKGDIGRYRNLMVRCARLREYSIQKKDETSPASFTFLANTWKAAADFEKAADNYRKALAAYEAEKNDEAARAVRLELIDLLVDQGKFDEAITPLEALLVPDVGARTKILERLGADDQLRRDELTEMLKTMSANKRVMDILSRAYLEAARDQKDLLRAINLTGVLYSALKEEEMFKAPWYTFNLRLATGYFKYGALTTNPEAYQNVVNLINSRIVIPGLLEASDEELPGAKKQFEELLSASKK